MDIPGSDSSAEEGGRRLAGARAESLLAGQMPTEGSLHTPKIQEICEGLTGGGGSPVHIQDGRKSPAPYQHTYDECTRMLTKELEKLNMQKYNSHKENLSEKFLNVWGQTLKRVDVEQMMKLESLQQGHSQMNKVHPKEHIIDRLSSRSISKNLSTTNNEVSPSRQLPIKMMPKEHKLFSFILSEFDRIDK